MRFAAITITVICCILMFKVKRPTKAAIFIMGAMTLTLVRVPFLPLQKANFIFPIVFLLSEWNYLKRHLKDFWHTPSLKYPVLVVIVSTIICILSSPRLSRSFMSAFMFFRGELIFKYFAICYAFWAYSSETSIKQTLKVSFYCLLVLTFFGILNYYSESAIFVNAVTVGKTSWTKDDAALGDVFIDSDRFRVISMFRHPFDYGFVCSAIFLLHFHGVCQQLESRRRFIIAALCCLFGIFFCGCRTVWVASAMAFICYSLWSFKLKKTSAWGLMAIMALILSYGVVPFIEEKMDQVSDILSDNPQTNGSSLKLRQSQFEATMDLLDEENEMTGQGEGYFAYDLGFADQFSDRRSQVLARGLYGMESVIFKYVLERGYLGLFLWALFYILIFIFFVKNRHKYKRLTGLGVSFVVLYLFFSIGTGELGSVYPTMLLLGFVIKAIEYDKRIKSNYNLNHSCQ